MGERARVAFLTNFVPPYRAPVLRALAERVAALRILVSTAMEGNRAWEPAWDGLDVVVQRTLSVPRRRAGGFRERLPLHIPLDTRRRLDAFEPDVVIAGELGARTLQAARWCTRRDRPLVIWATLSERTERGAGWPRRLLRRFLLKRAAAVIVNGKSGTRYIRGFGVPDARIHTVHYTSPVGLGGVDAGVVAAPPERVRGVPALRLLFVGQLVERKGVEPLIRGLGTWCADRGQPVVLDVVGTGPLEPRIRDLAAGAGPLLDVRLAGPVPFEAMADRYAAADVLAFPTLADEWGLVVNEAMASGLPVLGSAHGQAVTELVEEGRTGWVYDPERPGALDAALDRVVAAGPESLRRMGAAARGRVSGLTPERMADRLTTVIEDVLADHRRRP